MSTLHIGFVGGGNMAAALIAGLAKRYGAGLKLHVVDNNPDALPRFARGYGATTATAVDERLAACDVIVLAVKPQQMREVAGELAAALDGRAPLVLSVAAGIRAADLSRWLGGHRAIVRSMPNTPALIGAGITALAATGGVTAAQRELAQGIMAAVGATLWLDKEEQLDAVTAISGSGPAYVYYFIEALQQAAQELGLDPLQGRQLALATFAGAAQLAVQSGDPVEVLRERVTSKGGTTYAALTAMQQAGVKDSIVAGAKAAAARSVELGDEFGRD